MNEDRHQVSTCYRLAKVPSGILLLRLLPLCLSSLLLFCCSGDSTDKVQTTSEQIKPGTSSSTVVIGYLSLSGHTERFAEAVAKGVEEIEGIRANLKSIETITHDDLKGAGGLALGCPTHFANMPSSMKVTLDKWGREWHVDLTNKFGGAFATGSGQTGGKEHVVVSLLLFMLNSRMIIAGPLHDSEKGKWGEIGASAVTGPSDPGLADKELEDARLLGRRLAELVKGSQSERGP